MSSMAWPRFSTSSGFRSIVVSTRSMIAATWSRRTLTSACASTPLMSSRTFPRWAWTPTLRFTRSSTCAFSETLASRSSTSRWIESTLTTGTASRTSGSPSMPASPSAYLRYSCSAIVRSPPTFWAKRYFSGFWDALLPPLELLRERAARAGALGARAGALAVRALPRVRGPLRHYWPPPCWPPPCSRCATALRELVRSLLAPWPTPSTAWPAPCPTWPRPDSAP